MLPKGDSPQRLRGLKVRNGFLSWRQRNGERYLTPPAAPNERRAPNLELEDSPQRCGKRKGQNGFEFGVGLMAAL